MYHVLIHRYINTSVKPFLKLLKTSERLVFED